MAESVHTDSPNPAPLMGRYILVVILGMNRGIGQKMWAKHWLMPCLVRQFRETIPQIMVAPDPGSAWRLPDGRIDESLLSAWEKGEDDTLENYFLDGDPQSEAWMHDDQWGAPEHQPMPRDELEAMIQQIVDSGDDHFRWGNTGTNMPQEARRAHILGALERLQTNTRGQTYLPDEVKQFVNTSETDQITEGDDEEYLREWGRWNP